MTDSGRKPNLKHYDSEKIQNVEEARQFYQIKKGLEAYKDNVFYQPILDLFNSLDPLHSPIGDIKKAVQVYSPLFFEEAAKVFLKKIQEKKEEIPEYYPFYTTVVYKFRVNLENEINFDFYKKVALNHLPAAQIALTSGKIGKHYTFEDVIDLYYRYRENPTFNSFVKRGVITGFSLAEIMQRNPKPANIALVEELMAADKKQEKKASDTKKEAPKARHRTSSAPSVLFPPNLQAAVNLINESNKKLLGQTRKKSGSNK